MMNPTVIEKVIIISPWKFLFDIFRNFATHRAVEFRWRRRLIMQQESGVIAITVGA
jgi:hypothetical protein